MTERSRRAVPFSVVRRQWVRLGKLMRILVKPRYRRAFAKTGVAAAVEHERIDIRGDIRTVLDVGANGGQFALLASQRWPAARIVCFEPLAAARQRLDVVARIISNVEVRGLALGDSSGDQLLHIARADDSSSLLPISARQSVLFPGTDEVGVQSVKVRRLDEEVAVAGMARPVLMKIDVQGGELGVLRGAVGILDSVDVALVECSFVELYIGQALVHEIVAFMSDYDFVLSGAGVPTTDDFGKVVQQDFLFRRN